MTINIICILYTLTSAHSTHMHKINRLQALKPVLLFCDFHHTKTGSCVVFIHVCGDLYQLRLVFQAR